MTRTPGSEAEDVARVMWGVDSETGTLRDVLLGPPDNFHWLPTSAISKATLASGAQFDPELAAAQHRELVSIYESAGVSVHRLEPDPALPYQVFARDSSIATPESSNGSKTRNASAF